jgi:hypothetical protein
MLNFKDINYKSNINNNKSYKQMFSKQGKEIMKVKERISDKVDITLVNNNSINSRIVESKKQFSFKENFQSNPHKKQDRLFYFPKMNNVNKNIANYEERIQNADSLLNNANNLLNDTSMTDVKNTYSDELESYKELSDELNKNTSNYLSKGNKNKNIYVTSLSNNTDATFKGLYSDNLDNPSMTIIEESIPTFNYDDCKNTAFLTGKKYFGLIDTNKDNHLAKCAVSDTLDNTSLRGFFKDSCAPSNNDGFMYGGPWANAIYSTKDGIVNQDNYIGCYKDQQDGNNIFSRAMYPASWKVTWFSDILKIFGYYSDTSIEKTDETNQSMMDKLIYNPVYFSGASGSPPWGIDFIDTNAQWIWYTKGAADGAPDNTNSPELIFGAYKGPDTQTSYVTATIYCCCDNYCTIKINGDDTDMNKNKMVIDTWQTDTKGYTGYKVQLYQPPNDNIIELYVTNSGGPAGVIFAMLDDDNNVLFRSHANDGPTIASSDVNGTGSWLFSSKVSKVQVPLTNEFSVQSCADYANLIGFPYIGLQYIQNNEGGTAQCFVTNSLDNGTKFGSLGGSVEYNNKTYGIGPANAVYELNSTADPSLIGSLGYINENSQLLKYPDSMISYGNTYTELKDYYSNPDIQFYGTLDECKKKCNDNPECNGFSYSLSQNTGFFSNTDKVFGYRNLSEPLIKNITGITLYMRDPTVNNNETCSKSINPITAEDWMTYLKNNSDDVVSEMTTETTCGLYKTNEQIKQELEQANEKLNSDSDILVSNTTNLIKVNNDLNSQVIEDKNIIKNSSKLYNKIENKYASMFDNNNLNNILDNSNLVIKQSQYYYIIWIILILLIIIGVIIILRRI